MTGDEFRTLALSLDGTVEAAHFDRRAFKLRRIFASLAPDETTANIFISPEEQEHYVSLRSELFAPVPNKWGERGWTQLSLGLADRESVLAVLKSAWKAAGGAKR